MERTSHRALVTGAISSRAALTYCAALGACGLALLYAYANALTMYVALCGWFFYVVVYGLAKRAGWWGALVGSISGAIPIVVGYTAVTGRLDSVALVLFLVLVAWQMPHFYGIALYRKDEYAAAGIPVLPLVKGSRITKIEIIGYIVVFLLATTALFALGAAGYAYLFITLLVGLCWLFFSVRGARENDPAQETRWAKRVFLFSLVVLLVFSAALAAAPWLP
jgi:protoheme IX farnesyltransferase